MRSRLADAVAFDNQDMIDAERRGDDEEVRDRTAQALRWAALLADMAPHIHQDERLAPIGTTPLDEKRQMILRWCAAAAVPIKPERPEPKRDEHGSIDEAAVPRGSVPKAPAFREGRDVVPPLTATISGASAEAATPTEIHAPDLDPRNTAAHFTPTSADLDIEQALRDSPGTMHQADIVAACGHSAKVVKSRMPVLEKAGRVHRPHGKRKGYAMKPPANP